MKVEDVLAQLELLIGQVVTVEGFLVEKAPDYQLYLASNDENRDDVAKSIRVEFSIPGGKLDERLPSWLGTKYKHADPATLTGTVQLSDDGIFPAVIADLTKFTAKQYDEVIDIFAED